MPANANSGRSSFSPNQTTSFFFVSGFASGAYSAKLLTGTKHRFSGLSQPRQCGEDVLRMFVTGAPPNEGGGGIPHRIIVSSLPPSVLRITGAGEDARHRRQVADVAVDNPEQRDDGGLVSGDRIKVAHRL